MSQNLKQVDLARETLKVFEDHGEHMDDVRHVIHYFYGGNFKALGSALEELGYVVRPTAKNDGVVAERLEAIGEVWRTTVLPSLCELSDQYDVEYDGWEASLTRQSTETAQGSSLPQTAGWLSRLFGKKN